MGDGSITYPYEISTLANLYWIAENLNRWAYHYIQTADIDASASATWFNSMGWPSIGNEVTPFSGTYNGQGHTISGIAINHPSESNVGFFGYTKNATIKNLTLTNASITGNDNTGILAGSNEGNIANCYTSGVVNGGSFSGSFTGSNKGTIKNCYSTGAFSGKSFSGGFVGTVNSGIIQYCYNSETTSFANGSIAIGAFVGEVFSGSVSNCYWNSSIAGNGGCGINNGTFNGIGLTSDKMKLQSNFTGWDFVGETNNGLDNIWAIASSMNNGYPILASQVSPVVATISNVTATNTTYTSATISSSITNLGIPNPTQYGFCWSSDSDEPTTNSNNVNLGVVDGNQSAPIALTHSLRNLSPDKTYRIRAYATNMAGTIYSETLIVNAYSPAFTFASNASGSLSFSMKCNSNSGNYSINWGNGTIVEGTKSDQYISYSTTAYSSGTTVRVYADGVTGLDFNKKLLTAIDVSNCTMLANLIVSANNLSQLNVSNNNELVTFNCNSNSINSLDVKNNTKLTTLKCYNNNLNSLELSKNLSLTYLHCGNNNLSLLDVSANTLLKELSCYDNKLTSLDLTNNKQIEILYCYNNTLSSINVTGCTTLLGLSAYNNQLESIDVSTNTSMVALWINGNRFTIASLPQDKAIYHSMTSVNADYTYNYAPQQPIAVFSNNGTVDLSSQLKAVDINGVEQTTVYQWYLIDGTPLPSTNYTENNGVFTFTKTTADEVYCVMSNAAFPSLIDNNALRTINLKVIVAVEPVISWNNPVDIAYGTALSNTQLNATATYNGSNVDGIFVYNPAAGTVLNAGEGQALSVTFTPADAVNYSSAGKGVSINVAKASLMVAASDQSMKAGEALPELILSYAGFVNGEDESVLDTKPTATTTATTTSPAGTYDINVSSGSDNNYALTYVAGKLTITPATGIDDVAGASVTVYPNPFTNNLTITVDGNCNGRYTLTSLVGATVEQGIVEGGKANPSLSHLKPGVYMLRVEASGKVQTVKVIKQ